MKYLLILVAFIGCNKAVDSQKKPESTSSPKIKSYYDLVQNQKEQIYDSIFKLIDTIKKSKPKTIYVKKYKTIPVYIKVEDTDKVDKEDTVSGCCMIQKVWSGHYSNSIHNNKNKKNE